MTLARYMANNKLTDAQSAVDALCGDNTLSVLAKTASVSVYSDDDEEIITAATDAANKLSGNVSGNYGVGVNSYFKDGMYNIFIVVAYEK